MSINNSVRKRIEVESKTVLDDPKINSRYSHIIHLASRNAETFSSPGLSNSDPMQITWAKNIVRYANESSEKIRLIFASSGAVYGKTLAPIRVLYDEAQILNANSILTPYGRNKRALEQIFSDARESISVVNARLFTFYGPQLPLDKNFIIGNLMKAVVEKRSIKLKSSGTTTRSFMHQNDLAEALWKLAFSNYEGPVNVGEEKGITILELAEFFSHKFGLQFSLNPESVEETTYLPSTTRLKKAINFKPRVNFDEGVSEWYANIQR